MSVPDAAAVLGPHLDGGGVGDDHLPAVPGDVVVDPQLQGLEQGGLAVVAAPHDQGDPLGDAHAGDLAPVGQGELHRQLRRGLEGNRPLQGELGHPGGPGQDAAVGHKGAQPQAGQGVPEELLVLRQIRRRPELFRVQVGIAQGGLDALGQQLEQDLLQGPGVDGAAVGGEAHLQPQQHLAALGVHPAGGALQHLLAAPADGDQPAVARALGLVGGPGGLAAEPADQPVLEGGALAGQPVQLRREDRRPAGHPDAQPGGGGEGVPLDVVNGEGIAGKLIGTFCIFVDRIALPVDPGEQLPQFAGCAHGCLLSAARERGGGKNLIPMTIAHFSALVKRFLSEGRGTGPERKMRGVLHCSTPRILSS